jgi:pimeloyl-ACP methyl ester carboxylesterase
MSTLRPVAATTGTVRSADGTVIGYRQLGTGPGLALVHGGMQASQNLLSLAAALSGRFTVYIPDRRGRGLSGPYRSGHGLCTETSDLRALLARTGAHNVFGLSAGAIIALQTARSSPSSISKLALYEPPLSFDGVSHTAWVPRYERELAAGKLPSALVTIMKATTDRTALRYLPRFVLSGAIALAVNQGRATPALPGQVTLRELIPTMYYDARTVSDAAGPLERFAGLPCDVLLIGGSKSARNLTATLDALSTVLPGARRVTLPGAGHIAADNGGKPDLVAAQLRDFFA